MPSDIAYYSASAQERVLAVRMHVNSAPVAHLSSLAMEQLGGKAIRAPMIPRGVQLRRKV